MFAYENLCLLGFIECPTVPNDYKTLHGFNKAMTSTLGSSQRLTECVFSYLLLRYDSHQFNLRMKNCWPIADRKLQPKEFRNQLYKWLEQLRKEGKLSADFPLRRSYLDEGKGERFERMIMYLSESVMLKEMPKVPAIFNQSSLTLKRMTPMQKKEFIKVLNLHIRIESKKFIETCERRQDMYQRFSELSITLQTAIDKIKNELGQMKQRQTSPKSKESDFLDNVMKLDMGWKSFERDLTNSDVKESMKQLKMLISLPKNVHLDLTDFCLDFPVEYKSQWEEFLQQENVSLITPSRNFDFEAIMKILNLCLAHFHKAMKNSRADFFGSSVAASCVREVIDAKFSAFLGLNISQLTQVLQSLLLKSEILCKNAHSINDSIVNKLKPETRSNKEYQFLILPSRPEYPEINFLDDKAQTAGCFQSPEPTPVAVKKILSGEHSSAMCLQTPTAARRIPRLMDFANKSVSKQLGEIRSKLNILKSHVEVDKENLNCDESVLVDPFILDRPALLEETPPFALTPKKSQ